MNAFQHLLKSSGGHSPIGTWITSASPLVAEAIGCAGFDWAVIDMEHSPTDVMCVVQLLQAISSTKMLPVVRLPWNDAVVVKRVLDTGAGALLFPMVQSAAEAERAVATTRFPPEGVRGMTAISRASRFGTAALQGPGGAYRSPAVIVQLETPLALAQIDAIAKMPGVDALFVGPTDLAVAMGHPGQPQHPAVLDLMGRAVQSCKALGMPVGTIGGTAEAVAQHRASGFDFVALASDLGLMMRAASAALAALRTRDTEHVHSLSSGTRAAAGA